ncbi:P-loop containing nucleoside triphosphate hydrolase protein [Babesia caballi]|uniref:P-loop containing nucleoside triphosphate hydrolase protein n=1 Tax=Babesia caballi TaxID=5871 RepID=A0AAV4M025_BABCB|nr:P-loop containing nucleoside triphosphate hydrolase protein [Babesia caballi]
MDVEGKSAIVQGMALCFGGYGHSAGRDTALAHYIKDYHLRDGPNVARIEVTMSNHGAGSYKPEVYGDVVVLSRSINRRGSSFHMGGSSRKKATITKKELTQYLRHIKLSIGNPTTYMDQESSKSFFFQSNSSSFYRYYSAAAGLIEMEENLSAEKRNLEDCKAELKVRKRVLAPDREKLRDLSKQIKLFEDKLTEWRSAKVMYKLSQYRADKERYQALKETYDSFSQSDPKVEIVKLKKGIELFSEEQEAVKSEIQTMTAASFRQKEEITRVTDKIAALGDSISDTRSQVAAKQAAISQVETAMDNLGEELAAVAAEPADIEKQRLERELEACRQEYDEVDRQYEAAAAAISHVESTIAEIDTQLRAARSDLDEQKRENAALAVSGGWTKRAEAFRNSLYRYDVRKVLDDIARMRLGGLFTHTPIGPIGEYLLVRRDVPSPKVLAVVEHHLRNMLHTWLVATEQDRRALESVLVKHGCSRSHAKIMKSNIFSRPDLVEHTQRQLPETAHPQSIYRCLAVEHIPPTLLYVLADACNIGRAVICSDDEGLQELLSKEDHKVTVAYSMTRLNSGRRVNGSLHLSPCYDKHPFAYAYVRYAEESEADRSSGQEQLKGSCAERERSLMQLMSSLSKERSECTARLNEQRREMEAIRSGKTGVLRKRTRLEADLKDEIDHLESTNHSSRYKKCCEALEEIRADYRRQLAALEEELAQLEATAASLESDKAAQEEALKTANEDLKAALKRISGLRVDVQKIQQRVQIQKTQIKALEKNMKDYHFKLDGYVSDLQEAERQLRVHESEMDAEGIDYSVELPTKPPDDYLRILNLSNEVLQRIVDDSRGIEAHLTSLREQQAAAERALEDKERRLRETTANYQVQKKNYVKRCRRFEECRDRTERKAKRAFRQTLDAVTGYDGNLVFNDVNRTLEIQIHNKQQSYARAHVATDLKTLSGGEQSAIQLSMLQSLATISFSPIHMFDEVDVYMDEATRVKK